MSCLLCCFKSISFCGMRDCLLSCIAFHPPREHQYEIEADNADSQKTPFYKLVLPDPRGNKYTPKDAYGIESSVFWLQTQTNKLIPAIFFENKKATSNYVILYSHGNSTDLGKMRLALQELALSLNVHVFAYEYTGYGPSKGRPSDIEVIFNIVAAYNFLTDRLKIKWYQIILYGRSIGSGPSTYLASHPKYPVGGVILHSPLASGLRLMDLNMKETYYGDLFPNSDYISHVSAHVQIIHGELDVEVPVNHGKLLSTKCKNLYNPWWVPNGSHNDIDLRFRKAYFYRLNKFVKYVKDFNQGKTENELKEFYKVEEWHQGFNHIYFTKGPKVEVQYQKLTQKTPKPLDYGSFASHSSFLMTHNATNATFKANTESIITTLGDQTNRKIGPETTRSLTAKDYEEEKDSRVRRPSHLELGHISKPSDIEFSYSNPSYTERAELKGEFNAEKKRENQVKVAVGNNNHLPLDMSFDQVHLGTTEDPHTKMDTPNSRYMTTNP